jgi:hypothetical protein
MVNKKEDMCINEAKVKEILKEEMSIMEFHMSVIRKTLIWAASTLVPGLLFIGIWVGTVQSQVNSQNKEIEIVRVQHNRFEDKVDAKLERIENLLINLTDKVK